MKIAFSLLFLSMILYSCNNIKSNDQKYLNEDSLKMAAITEHLIENYKKNILLFEDTKRFFNLQHIVRLES